MKRCLFVPRNAHVYFCDIVLADILTSFAKVIGDVWLSLCMILPGGSLLVFPQQEGWSRLMVPVLMRYASDYLNASVLILVCSVPYAMRLRQCVVDYSQPTTTSRKQLYNAVKYATSFPVIFLSAAQRGLLVPSPNEAGSSGEHPLFRLW